MTRFRIALAVCWCLAVTSVGAAREPQLPPDGVRALLTRLEQVMVGGRPDAYLDLLGRYANRQLAADASRLLINPAMTRAVLLERDRVPLEGTLPGDGYRLMVEAFVEYGDRARLTTWRFDVRRTPTEQGPDTWAIISQEQLSVIDGLYRLSLNTQKQFRVSNLVVHSEDIEIRMPAGRVFVSETQEGTTGAVLLPDGPATFSFRPAPQTEQEQVRLFSGSDRVEDNYREAFVRISPLDFQERFSSASWSAEPVDAELLRRATVVFRDEVSKSFGLDMGEFSRDNWSLTPSAGDMLAELRTARFQTLTYTKSSGDAEDITLFDRRRRKNISVYASQAKNREHGTFFDEDAGAPYDITDLDVDVRFDPERQTMDGRVRMQVVTGDAALGNLTLKLADSLNVRTVFSPMLGRLLFLRIRNQNSIVINLPTILTPGTTLPLLVEYGGRITPSTVDRESLSLSGAQEPFIYDTGGVPAEPSWLYTTRTFWYPQAAVTDYARAVLRVTVPQGFGVLASGELASGSPSAAPLLPGQRRPGRTFSFSAPQPLRYLTVLISRLQLVAEKTLRLEDQFTRVAPDGSTESTRPIRSGVFYDDIHLSVQANPRLRGRGRSAAEVAESVTRFFAGLVGDVPYPGLALGLIENDLPGGHSPAYMSVIHYPLPQTNFTWANDPSAFPNYPEFFIAHEIAHQWWGQAVGWRSYHEQWISEGFAQYFAALYAERANGDQVFQDVLRKMARSAREQSAQGPISLGYRLGHIRSDARVFRSLVYNKAALTLHNLRLLLGNEAFFKGLRRFYFDWRFRKAATIDVQRAFEAESGQDLSAFFDGWFHTSTIPVVEVSWSEEGSGATAVAVLRMEQVGSVFEVPLPVTLIFADRSSRVVMVPVRERSVTVRIPTGADVRDIIVNEAGTALVDVIRK